MTQLQIPEPCPQKWSEMQSLNSDCRFCAVCTKNIFDFTHKTDAEILEHLRKNNGNICGKFRPDQLNRPLLAPVKNTRRTGLTAIAASFATLLSAQQPAAEKPATQTPIEQSPNRDVLGGLQHYNYLDSNDLRVISGKILDENNEPLMGASIWHEGSNTSTQTDLDGIFNLKILVEKLDSSDLNLHIRFTGYPEKMVPLPKQVLKENLALLPETTRFSIQDIYVLGGPEVIAKPNLKSKFRNFFRKLFN